MKDIKGNIIYVTRDLERALGLPLHTKGYYIITNYSSFANKVCARRKNTLLIKDKKLLDTHELLAHPRAKRFINSISTPGLVVFKNTGLIERICAQNNWNLINNSAIMSATIEEKISQLKWLKEWGLEKYLPPHDLTTCKQIEWRGRPFILQFNRAHTGNGTMLIKNRTQLQLLKNKFPKREVRFTEYINGPMFTNNNVVWGKDILFGNISYQITGLFPFTALPFATVGNDWALPHKILNIQQIKKYYEIARVVGDKLAQQGYRGLFGIDVMLELKTGKLYLIEINARQPASTSYESQLQQKAQTNGLTIFLAHLLALQNRPHTEHKLTTIKDGAQIIKRLGAENIKVNTKVVQHNIKNFSKQGFNIVDYENYALEKDWLRIQSDKGIMDEHNLFNGRGSIIINFIFATVANIYYSNRRASVIIINNKKVLLVRRVKKHCQPYFVVPGGMIDKGETPLQAARREIKEETNLKVVLDNKFVHYQPREIDNDREDFCFFAKQFSGRPKIIGEEKEFNRPENSYALKWVPLNKIKDLIVYPHHLKKYLIQHY